jgi:methylated-DNA-[protein]-cysteine S-methyltransferase
MSLFYKEMKSPVGRLKLVATHDALVAVLWEKEKTGRVKLFNETNGMEVSNDHPILKRTESQLTEYFEGKRKVFDLPLAPLGTIFQNKVWKALREIPFGASRSYGELARTIGSPKASRAVGAANGRNPLSIIVPCHRVIGADGKLTGFAGGLEAKQILLSLEKVRLT